MTDNLIDARTAVRTATLARVLIDQLNKSSSIARSVLTSALRTGESAVAEAPDGTLLGRGTIAKGAVRARVTDAAAFTAWVVEHYPDETQTVISIRPAFEAKILASSKTHGEPVGPGGELDVPGLDVSVGDPSPRITPTPEAEVWALNLVKGAGLHLAIEGDA